MAMAMGSFAAMHAALGCGESRFPRRAPACQAGVRFLPAASSLGMHGSRHRASALLLCRQPFQRQSQSARRFSRRPIMALAEDKPPNAEAPPAPAAPEGGPTAEELEELEAAMDEALEALTEAENVMNEAEVAKLDLLIARLKDNVADGEAMADLLEMVDRNGSLQVPVEDFVQMPVWKQQFMGVDRIRQCARFLIRLGVRPEDVDRCLEGAALAAAASVAAQMPDLDRSTFKFDRDVQLMRGFGVLEVELFMEPVTWFLEQKGIEEKQWPGMFAKCPALLGSGVIFLEDAWDFLYHEVFIPKDALRTIVQQEPWVLVKGRDAALLPVVDYLKGLGVESEALPNMLLAAPSVLLKDRGELVCKVEFLASRCRVPRDKIPGLLISVPQVFEMDFFAEWTPKVDFLEQMMGKAPREVEDFPEYLGYHFPSQILPRHAFLVEKAGAAEASKVTLRNMLLVDDEVFAKDVAGASMIEYLEFRSQPRTLRLFSTLLTWYDNVGATSRAEMQASAQRHMEGALKVKEEVEEGGGGLGAGKEGEPPKAEAAEEVQARVEEHFDNWDEARRVETGGEDDAWSPPSEEDVPWLAPSLLKGEGGDAQNN